MQSQGARRDGGLLWKGTAGSGCDEQKWKGRSSLGRWSAVAVPFLIALTKYLAKAAEGRKRLLCHSSRGYLVHYGGEGEVDGHILPPARMQREKNPGAQSVLLLCIHPGTPAHETVSPDLRMNLLISIKST